MSIHSTTKFSSPREAPSADGAGVHVPSTQPPLGGSRIVHGAYNDTNALLDVLLDGFRNSVWILAGKDFRVSADLLERAGAALQEESNADRRRAKLRAREAALRAGEARGEVG